MIFTSLTDSQLVARFQDLLMEDRERLVLQLETIGELDRRKLFFHYPSLWSYLVHELGMEESSAERKIRAARLVKRFPQLKSELEAGRLDLSLLEIVMGCAHREKLEDDEFLELVSSLSGKSCKAARREVVRLNPQSMELPRDRVTPLSEELSEVRFVASQELLDKLDEIKGLLAHSHPGITLAELIDVMATEYRNRHHPEEKAKRSPSATKVTPVRGPEPQTRMPQEDPDKRIPNAAQVHALTLNKGFRCTYVDPVTGKTCGSTFGLEIHHKRSWSSGGKTQLDNLTYLCRGHHRRESFLEFGEPWLGAGRTQGWSSLKSSTG